MTARTQTELMARLVNAIEDAGRVLDDPLTPKEREGYDDDAARDAYYADQPEVAFIDEHPKWGKR